MNAKLIHLLHQFENTTIIQTPNIKPLTISMYIREALLRSMQQDSLNLKERHIHGQ